VDFYCFRGLVGYQGNLGGKMVYEYGIGVKVQKAVPTNIENNKHSLKNM